MANNIFSLLKSYSLDGWKLAEMADGTPNPRKFTPEELEMMGECVVVKGNYSLAVKITLPAVNRATWISIDKGETVAVGDILDKNDLQLAYLVYTGDNPEVKVREKLVVRIMKEKKSEEASFKNPFGIF